MSIRKATPADLSIMMITMMFWALSFIGMKVAVPETGPFWLAAYRAMLGFCVVLPPALWLGLHWPRGGQQWLFMGIIVALNITFPVILISWAELTLEAGIASLLMGTGPFMALFLGHVLTRDEKFSWTKLVAVLMGFSGVIAIVGVDIVSQVGPQHLLPQLAVMSAALMFVIAGFTVRKMAIPPLSLAAVSLGLGSLVLVPLSLITSGPIPLELSSSALWWLIFIGIAGTGFGFIARYYLIQKIGYSIFSIGVNMIPVFGVIAGAVILNEKVEWATIIALVLVVGGLFVARLGKSAP